jgi:hypothetical protein
MAGMTSLYQLAKLYWLRKRLINILLWLVLKFDPPILYLLGVRVNKRNGKEGQEQTIRRFRILYEGPKS